MKRDALIVEKLMMGTATLNLAAFTKMGISEFKNAVHPEVIIDAKLHIVPGNGEEEIIMDVIEFLEIQLKACDPESGYEIVEEEIQL